MVGRDTRETLTTTAETAKPRTTVFERIKGAVHFTIAVAAIPAESLLTRVKVAGKPSVRHFCRDYAGQPILLVALFQKGALRPDILRFLERARAKGYYVVAVNTLQVAAPAALEPLIDCYVERPNFGRDFGSYREGFRLIFGNGWHLTCPRLLMVNDSVYHATRGAEAFLGIMRDTDQEVLGATENFEIEHHLGSFCISLAPRVLRHRLFQEYWRKYRLTDIRPIVIRRGEMKLSKVLKRCVSTPQQFGAHFSAAWFQTHLNDADEATDQVLELSRNSPLVDWPRITTKHMLAAVEERFIVPRYRLDRVGLQFRDSLEDADMVHSVLGFEDVVELIRRKLVEGDQLPKPQLRILLNSYLMYIFIQGSQIHQNAAVLLSFGLPIVKLDGFYRGMFDSYDLNMIASLLSDTERAEFMRIVMARPFGGDVLSGWRLAAFRRGLI